MDSPLRFPINAKYSIFQTTKPVALKQEPAEAKKQIFNDLKELFDNKVFSDFIIRVDGREIQAHKNILYARSSYFSAMLSHDFVENTNNVMEIKDCDYEAVNEMLRFLYCGEVKDLDKVVYELLPVSDKVNI